MPNLLAFDASSEQCSVALALADGTIVQRFEHAPRRQAQLLLPMIRSVLDEAKLSSSDISLVAFGRGPGSFTGLRIAAGVAQGLCFGADCLALPVSNIEAMAFERLQTTDNGACLVTIDARMDEVYWGMAAKLDGRFVTSEQEYVCAPESLAWRAALSSFNSPSLALECVGSGLAYQERFPEDLLAAIDAQDEGVVPRAESILALAQYKLSQGEEGVEAHKALPTYLRDQVAWKKIPEQGKQQNKGS